MITEENTPKPKPFCYLCLAEDNSSDTKATKKVLLRDLVAGPKCCTVCARLHGLELASPGIHRGSWWG